MPVWFELLWPVLAILAFLAALSVLRVLAIFRQRLVESHDVAREAVRMRRAYEESQREKAENPIEA